MSAKKSTEKIGLAVATIVGMNAMIGSGIFTAPAALASSVGPAGILTYAFVIVAVWFLAQSLARVAQLYPQEGSFYTYAKQWGGHAMGMISAGAYLVGLLIAMGLLSQMAGYYLQHAFPVFSHITWGIITLTALTALNMIGVVMSEAGQIILICCTVFPLIASIVMCLTKADLNNLTPFMPYDIKNLFSATKAVIFGFFGFECAASLFNVVKNPEKNVSKALTYSIILVGSLYLLFVGSLILSVPLKYFADPLVPLPKVLEIIFPDKKWMLNIIHFSILSAIIGTLHSMIWSSSALLTSYFKQFKNKAIQQWATKRLHQWNAVLIVGVSIFASFSLLKSPNLFFSITALLIVFAYSTSIITLLTLPKEWKSGQNIKTIIGLGTAGIIFYFAAQGLAYGILEAFSA